MNNLFIKLVSLFVILIFCLSPLGAIDLNQGDNITHVNDNNSTELKDVNDTVKDNDAVKLNDSDIEINKVNDTTDLKESGNGVGIQNLSSKDSLSTGDDDRVDAGLCLKIDDINYGEKPILKIWAKYKYFYKGDVKILVSGPDYSSESNFVVYRYNKEYKLNDDLLPGTYVVTLVYDGDPSYFKPATIQSFFTVKKLNTNLKAKVDDIELGQKVVVRVNCDEDLDGNITISSNFSEPITVSASQGSFTYEFADNLTPGDYHCIVSYSGDKIHDQAISGQFFTVNKLDPNMTISVNDVPWNQKPNVKIKANETINGNVRVDLIGPKYGTRIIFSGDVKLVDGVGNLTIDNDLIPGNYTAIASFEGDDTFKASEKSTEFIVERFIPS